MSYIKRTLITQAAVTTTVQHLVVGLAGEAAAGMFTIGLSPTGAAPATHYISSGAVGAEFGAALSSPEAMQATCQVAAVPMTLAQCKAILSQCVIVDLGVESAQETLTRLGLAIVQDPENQ